MNVNRIALCTSSTLGAATIASTVSAIKATDPYTRVTFAVAAVIFGSLSGASAMAWMDKRSIDVNRYFTNLKKHSGHAITNVIQIASRAFQVETRNK